MSEDFDNEIFNEQIITTKKIADKKYKLIQPKDDINYFRNKPQKTFKSEFISISKKYTKELEFVNKIKEKEKECDNDYERNDLFIKLKNEEFNCAFYTVLSITTALFYHDMNTYPESYTIYTSNKDLYTMALKFLLITTTINSLLFSKNFFIFSYVLCLPIPNINTTQASLKRYYPISRILQYSQLS